MKINGFNLGVAIMLTGIILENHYIFMKESLIGLIIIVVGCLVNWYFSFENEEENKEWIEKK